MDMLYAKSRVLTYCIGALAGASIFLSGMLLGAGLTDGAGPYASQTPQAAAPSAAPLATIEPAATPQALTVAQMGAPSVLPETAVVWECVFDACGHTLTEAGEPVVGLTQAELQARYTDCEVVEFTQSSVRLCRHLAAYCPAHLLLTLREGRPVILQTNAQSYQSEEVMQLELEVADLSEAQRKRLEEGIAFEELAQIDEFIENVES